MILYDLNQKFSLGDFGIEIPISDNRVKKTLEYLSNHPFLGDYFEQNSIKSVTEKISKNDLLRVHSEEYVNRLYSDQVEKEIQKSYELIDSQGNYHRYNPQNAKLPLSLLFENELEKAAGTLQCCKIALETGFCFYFGGGSHHAQRDSGAGFCVINDMVIAIRNLQANHRITTAWVIDVDAHKGDGTAALTEDDGTIATLSIHMAKGWPLDSGMFISGKLNPSFIPSTIDIPVERGEDDEYVKKLEEGLSKLDEFPVPEIAIVVSGVDPYEKDMLPSSSGLKLTLEQMKERDLLVYRFLQERKIPQAYVMAGGYGPEGWRVHAQFLEYVLLDLFDFLSDS